MSDKALLEAAARAAGIELLDRPEVHSFDAGLMTTDGHWSPLTDDGDALRLAVKRRIIWGWQRNNMVWARCEFDDKVFRESNERGGVQDEMAAMRRAIVRAAAALGADK